MQLKSMIKNILVPLDGSEHAFKALDFASGLADKHTASLLLLYVVTKREIPESVRRFAEVENIKGPPAWIYDEVIAKNILQEGKQRAQEKGATSIETAVRDGDPARVIVDVANSKNVDVIAMGTRGLSDLQGIFVGSVAHKVSHLAECTVITVK